jgi:hypothetical protein
MIMGRVLQGRLRAMTSRNLKESEKHVATTIYYADWAGAISRYGHDPGVIGVLTDPANPFSRIGEAHAQTFAATELGRESLFHLKIGGEFIQGAYVCRARVFIPWQRPTDMRPQVDRETPGFDRG